MSAGLSVLTLNLQNVRNRYEERRLLLVDGFVRLAPDVAALQEVALAGDEPQDEMLAEAVPGRRYSRFSARSARYPDFGNALLVGVGEAASPEELRLSHGRCALRVRLRLEDGVSLWLATTHLHHRPADAEERLRQVREILVWLRAAPPADGVILAGDFNALPSEPAIKMLAKSGYRSAFRAIHGHDPERTRPSGGRAEGMDAALEPGCVDYIWVSESLRPLTCDLVLDSPAPWDPTLFASDHFGLLAVIAVAGVRER